MLSRRIDPAAVLLAFAVPVAAVVGVMVVVAPTMAIAVAIGAVAVPASVLRPKLLIYLVVIVVFTEFLTVGGFTIGRLAAPVVLIAVIAEWVHAPVRFRDGTRVLAFVFGYAFVALASLLWTLSWSGTVAQLGSLAVATVYMASFAVLVRTPTDLRRLFWGIAACSAALGLFWISSYLHGTSRAATAGDPNFFAADQVVALAVVVVLATSTMAPSRQLVLYVLAAMIAASVVASLSRSGFLALVVAGLLMLILPGSLLFRTRARKITFFVAAALGLALILPIAGTTLKHRFHEGVSQTGERRRDLWLAAMGAYQQHPLLGIGYGAFQPTMFQWVVETPGVNIRHFSAQSLRTGQPVHNAYLGSLTELGPAGLAAFLGVLVATAGLLYRTARRAGRAGDAFVRSGAVALLIGLVAFGVASAFLPAETSRVIWMFVGLSLALPMMVSVDRPPRHPVHQVARRTARVMA